MTDEHAPTRIDEATIELIAARVAMQLREELEAIAADLVETRAHDRPLSVDDVAERFGVARSTVYAHWQEWGGYKLGDGQKAPIRFPAEATRPTGNRPTASDSGRPSANARKRRRSAPLRGAPKLPIQLGDDPQQPEQGPSRAAPGSAA
jgi:transposase-like protein